MDVMEILILVAMFLVRILLPVAILLGVGFLYEYFLEKRATRQSPREASMIDQRAATSFIAMRQPTSELPEMLSTPCCWDIMHCTAEQRATCPAAQRQGVPCWVTMQLLTGHLPDRCITCEIFKETSHHDDFVELTSVKE